MTNFIVEYGAIQNTRHKKIYICKHFLNLFLL